MLNHLRFRRGESWRRGVWFGVIGRKWLEDPRALLVAVAFRHNRRFRQKTIDLLIKIGGSWRCGGYDQWFDEKTILWLPFTYESPPPPPSPTGCPMYLL